MKTTSLKTIAASTSYRAVLWLTVFAVALLNFTVAANAANVDNFKVEMNDASTSGVSHIGVSWTIDSGSGDPIAENDVVSIALKGTGASNKFAFVESSDGYGSASMTVLVDGVTTSVSDDPGGSCTTGSDWEVSTSTPGNDLLISLERCAASAVAAGSEVIVNVIDQDSSGGSIMNPVTEGSYVIGLEGTTGWQDSGEASIAIVDDITATATVSSTMTFTILGVASGQNDFSGQTGEGNTTIDTTSNTPTTLDWGVLDTSSAAVADHELKVETNASGGYVVYVQQSGNLTNSNGDQIDQFDDGSAQTAGDTTAWSSPAETEGTTTTYGHFGVTTDDATAGGASCATTYESGSTQYYAAVVSSADATTTTPGTPIMCHTGPSSGETEDQGNSVIRYRTEITSLQEAGEYTHTLHYIVVPTF